MFAAAATGQTRDFQLGPGDLINVKVFQNPDLSGDVRISETGTIAFPLVGELKVTGLTTGNAGTDNGCDKKPPIADPAVNNNRISQNKVSGNDGSPPRGGEGPLDFLAADITYFTSTLFGEVSSGNCFEKNKPSSFSFFSTTEFAFPGGVPTPIPGPLPTDGC